MSLALIQESAKEARRLAIAGSPLAVGDFRLKKMIAPLEQAGAKVPVFAQVAKAISDLVNGKEADSATHLLNLSTLLNAILYTQGQSSVEGEYRELEMVGSSKANTRTPARQLKPLVQALTTSGGGRFEIVKSAVDRGAFNDLRLIAPAIEALGDNFPEMADLVAEKVLPAFGPGIVPLLKAGLNLKGKKQDARRLLVMHQLDAAGTLPLCKSALEDGSADVKEAAISCLGQHEECLPLVLEQATAKNKQLRAAAVQALAAYDRPEVTALFTKLILGKDLDEMADALPRVKSRVVFEALLAEGSKAMQKALKNESAGILRFYEVLHCLEGRTDAPTEGYLLSCCEQAAPLAKVKAANCVVAGPDLLRQIVEMLYRIGSPKSLETILANQDKLPVDCFQLVVQTAIRVWPPEKVFVEFSPLLQHKKGAGKEKAAAVERAIRESMPREFATVWDDDGGGLDAEPPQAIKWDPRWLDAAVKADQYLVVCYLARPGHNGAVDFLVESLDSRKQYEAGFTFHALARCEYSKLTDLFLETVTKTTKKASQNNWAIQQLFASARFLPAKDLPKLDAFAATLDEKFVDPFLEALGPLREAKP